MRGAFELGHVLLVEVSFDSHKAPRALLEVGLLRALIKFVLGVATHFNDLSTACTVSQHLTLQHVMEVHFLCAKELR